MKIPFLAIVCFLFLTNTFLFGQQKEPANKYLLLEMRDGNTLQGKIIEKRGDTLVIETTTLGLLNVSTKNVKNIIPLDNNRFVKGEFWFENPHGTRGFFAPTGHGLRKGEGYYSNIFLFINSAAYGFTDNFTVGVGADVFTIFTGNAPLMLYVTPKLSFKAGKNFSYGVGVLAGSFGWNDERTGAGIVYGIGTIGDRDKNASIGLGYGYADGKLADRPVVTLSGQYRAGRKVSLMTENYILPGGFFGTTGVRLMNVNFAFDLGILYYSESDLDSPIAPFPFLGVAFPFGHKKVK